MNESLEKVMLWPDVSSYTYEETFASGAIDWTGTIIDGLVDVKPGDKEWLDIYEYVPPKPQQPWVIFDEANDLYTYTIAAGGRVGPRMAKPHECIHCYKPRHPGPITEKVAGMLASHRLDPDYDPDTDDSPIVCIGSDYEGPMPAPRPALQSNYNWSVSSWTNVVGGEPSTSYSLSDLNQMKSIQGAT